MFSSTNSSRPGVRLGGQQGQVVLAEDPGAHEAEHEADLAGRDPAVGDRHGGLAEAAAGRHDLVEELALEPADQAAEAGRVGPDPAGPVDDPDPVDDPGQLGPERLAQARHDPGHRRGVGRLGRRAARPRTGCRAPCAVGRSPPARPAGQSTSPRRAERSVRRPRTVAATPSAEPTRKPGLPDAVVATAARRPRWVMRRPRERRRSRRRRSPGPKSRSARARNASASPVVELAMDGLASGGPGPDRVSRSRAR